MSYPSEFSIVARNRVEAAKLLAFRPFEQARRSGQYRSEVEALRAKGIMQVFLAFAREVCALGKRKADPWPVDKINETCLVFLERLTHSAYGDYGDRVPASSFSGLIHLEVEQALRKLSEWQEYRGLLLEVATGQTAPPTGRRQKPGPKPNLEAAQRVAQIVCQVAPSRLRDKLDEVCEALDQAQVPPPHTWRKRGLRNWLNAADTEPELAVKAIRHHLRSSRQP